VFGDFVRKNEEKLFGEMMVTIRETREYRELVGILNPLVNSIHSSDSAKNFIKPYAAALQNRFKKSGERMMAFREIVDKLPKGETGTLLNTFVYLGLFETSMTNMIDLILLLLISLDHDFYLSYHRRYAKELEDLDSPPLAEKLHFLNKHNLQVFSKNMNKFLRNKIAHMEFDIESDGRISIDNQKYDIEREIDLLMIYSAAVVAALQDSGAPELLAELLHSG